MGAWLGSLDHTPGGGESFRVVEKRVLASLDRLLAEFAGKTVLAVSHVTPIKVLVAHALGAPLDSVYRMELAPASVTVLSYFPDGNAIDADVQRPSDGCRVHRSLTTTSTWVPCRPAGPSSAFQPRPPRWSANRGRAARRRAVLQQRADDPALRRLVEVRDHLPLAADLVQHPHGHDLAGQVGAGRQKAPYVEERRSTTRPRPAAPRTESSSRLLQ